MVRVKVFEKLKIVHRHHHIQSVEIENKTDL